MSEIRFEELDVEERRKKIIEILTQEGKVKVAELSKLFGISEVTIRNDLTELESVGLLERVHGGAVSTYRAYYNMSLHERMVTNEQEKRRIASEVASMVSDGDTIMISSGTTALYALQEMKNTRNLTIVTNSVSIAQETGYQNNAHIILLGGNFNSQYKFTYGDDTISQLKRYKADMLILGADGISSSDGVTTYHHLEAEVSRQMISRVNKTVVIADYSKVGRTSFAFIDKIENIDYLVTDQKANRDEIKALVKKGVEVRQA